MFNSTVLLVGSLVLGQAAQGPPSASQHFEDQKIFIGDWEGSLKLPDKLPDAPDWVKPLAGKNVTIRLSIKWGPEKGYQVIDTEAVVPGLSIKGTILKVWDPAVKGIKQIGCDSMGGWREITWTKQNDGNCLIRYSIVTGT